MSYNAKSEARLLEANIKINKLTSELEEANRVYLEIVGRLQRQSELIAWLELNNKDLRLLIEGRG